MRNLYHIKFLVAVFSSVILFSCTSNSSISKNTSSLTGWKFNSPKYGNFTINKNYKKQKIPSGMVLVEGGTFTMGRVQEDVMGDWNTLPKRIQLRSFYMDEAEVTNSEYLFYLLWLERVFPPENSNYAHIYKGALPDTLVWRNALGNNESLSQMYLRHPAYANYPVVGVSWVQANDFCEWRTDRVNEKILMDLGVLKNLFDSDSSLVEGKNNFSTDTYYSNPRLLFDGDSSIYNDNSKFLKRRGRHIKPEDGVLYPHFRLPTEAEWEYAAKSLVENREYSNIRGRKKYPWTGRHTRRKNGKRKGDQLSNFKQGRGDYNGLAGWSNDGADITNRIKSYPPNAFGLYDMAGNVSEWVYDVYRSDINTDMNDFNYVRGNIFMKKMIEPDGKVSVVDYDNIVYDTLPNGRIIPQDIPGRALYVPIEREDALLRFNYSRSDNSDIRDGDLESSRFHSKNVEEFGDGLRMYNHPLNPERAVDSSTGEALTTFDNKFRTTLVSNNTRVYKGGSWRDREFWLDPSQRRFLPEFMATNYIGFRCALDIVYNPDKGKRKPFFSR